MSAALYLLIFTSGMLGGMFLGKYLVLRDIRNSTGVDYS